MRFAFERKANAREEPVGSRHGAHPSAGPVPVTAKHPLHEPLRLMLW